jgi:hypothetical protein
VFDQRQSIGSVQSQPALVKELGREEVLDDGNVGFKGFGIVKDLLEELHQHLSLGLFGVFEG